MDFPDLDTSIIQPSDILQSLFCLHKNSLIKRKKNPRNSAFFTEI